MSEQCAHPEEKRWQYPTYWLCCACGLYFWGDKKKTPAEDVYGRAVGEGR